MTFDTPLLLVLGAILVAALVAMAVVLGRRRARELARAGASRSVRGAVATGLAIAGVGMLGVAMAGPVAMIPVPRTAGTVVLAMDVSNSMAAEDVAPNRLGVAKEAATDLIEAQGDNVDIGVVAFQDGALTALKPTAEHTDAIAAIKRLKIDGGTSLGDAILVSLSAITGKTVTLDRDGTAPDLGYWGSATIVLVSDGENDGNGADPVDAATVAQNAGVHIETIGVGTTQGGTVKVDGYSLHTALDEDALTSVATTTGGQYHAASDAAELNGVGARIGSRLEVSDEPVALVSGLIAVALALLVATAVLSVQRVGRLI